MSGVDVAAIRARADAATEEAWVADRGLIRTRDGFHVALTHVARPENAEFIAHARQDVPALLDALAEAERQRDEWHGKWRTAVTQRDIYEDERDDALAKIARVRSLAEVVARLQPADPDTHDRDVSWLALLDALDPDDAALADPEPTP